MKVLAVRVDRLGDLLVTLPIQNARHENVQVSWAVSQGLEFVMEAARLESHTFFVPPAQDLWEQLLGAYRLAKQWRAEAFDGAVAFHVPWWVALGLWWAGIPRRFGTASQWFSFLFYNSRLTQHRSLSDRHEATYNLELWNWATGLLNANPNENPRPAQAPRPFLLTPTANATVRMDARLAVLSISSFVVVHAGMLGSARNWSFTKYAELIRGLQQLGFKVVLTGGSADVPLLEAGGLFKIPRVVSFVETTTGEDLIALLKRARAVIAPSTGVAHLASAVGTSVVGLYSPVRVQAPTRWGPLGQNTRIAVPEVQCPGMRRCLGAVCSEWDCMEKITVDSILNYVRELT